MMKKIKMMMMTTQVAEEGLPDFQVKEDLTMLISLPILRVYNFLSK